MLARGLLEGQQLITACNWKLKHLLRNAHGIAILERFWKEEADPDDFG
jgi:hypothetical protein